MALFYLILPLSIPKQPMTGKHRTKYIKDGHLSKSLATVITASHPGLQELSKQTVFDKKKKINCY